MASQVSTLSRDGDGGKTRPLGKLRTIVSLTKERSEGAKSGVALLRVETWTEVSGLRKEVRGGG